MWPLLSTAYQAATIAFKPLHWCAESASRFACAAEIAAQARMMFNLMAVSCQTFILGQILINYAFGATVAITHGNDGGGDEDRRGVHHAAKSGGYCAAKIAPPIKTFALRMLQHPLRLAKQIRLNQIDHRAPLAQRKRRPWSTDVD